MGFGKRENKEERKKSIEHGADGGHTLYYGGRVGRVDGHLRDMSRLDDVSGRSADARDQGVHGGHG